MQTTINGHVIWYMEKQRTQKGPFSWIVVYKGRIKIQNKIRQGLVEKGEVNFANVTFLLLFLSDENG